MKKKIVFGLAIFALMFFFGGVYIVTTTETTIYDLHRLSQLHGIVALRKDLLLSIKKTQHGIILRGKQFVVEETAGDESTLGILKKCLGCHQTSPSREAIISLRNQIEDYHEKARAVFASLPGSTVSESRAGTALRLGNDLIGRIEGIISVTSAKLEEQEREMLGKIQQRKVILFTFVTIGPFFAVGLALILINGLASPLNSLLAATRRLKAGDLDHRIRGLRDEFGEVADSFNEMAESLKKQMQELQRTEQLRISGEMAAGLAHEIRNPLAGMKVSIEVLLSELTIDERDRDILRKVIEQIRNIELLMKNLLNYARPVAAQPVRVDVNKVLEKTIYFIERHPSFNGGNPRKRIVKEFNDKLPEVIVDPQQLQQVFLNLLLNAADAIPDGGQITARTCADEEGRNVAIELHDTGKGIPPELAGKIFLPFFTTKGTGKGSGLGLAVSKRIVEEHGGSIQFANNSSGGVTFTIMLPVKAEDDRGATV
jgi:signal transduction histidine kinase